MRSLLVNFPPRLQTALLVLSICAVLISHAHGQIVINEIYYDHPGKDEDHEFIELINVGPVDVCIDAYRVEFHNGSGSGWELVWRGSQIDTIRSSRLFVIGGSEVSPRPDAVMSFSLQNGPDALRLIFAHDPLDLVGYGSLQDEEYVEGTGAAGAPAGHSLCRRPDGRDTDDNGADFHPMEPSPGEFNLPDLDVALALMDGTERAGAVEPAAVDEIRFLLVNRGAAAIPEQAVSVRMRDSSQAAVRWVDGGQNPQVIEPGKSRAMAIRTGYRSGYHFLNLQAFYDADQRHGNNSIHLVRRTGSPDIFISEIMSCPPDPCPQYIELFNAGDEPYDLGGHLMKDRIQAYSPLASRQCLIDADEYLVLTKQKQMLLSFFPALLPGRVVEMEGAWPHLNHSGSGGLADSIFIGDCYGIPIEAVDYPPQSSSQCGRSLERVDLFASAGSPVWILSRDPNGGSPGTRSESSILFPPVDEVVSVSPNPFSPGGGERLSVAVASRHGVARTTLSVFDSKGRLIRVIGSSCTHPYVFIWDGARDDGTIVPAGIYILACELYSSDGKRMGVGKVVVGCGRKRRN